MSPLMCLNEIIVAIVGILRESMQCTHTPTVKQIICIIWQKRIRHQQQRSIPVAIPQISQNTHTLNRTLWWWLLCTCKYVSTRNRHENVSTAEIYILYIKYILSSVQIYSIKMHVPNASVSLFCFVSAPPSHLYLIKYDCIRSIQRPCEMSNEHKITK